jgi:hypothetical protein
MTIRRRSAIGDHQQSEGSAMAQHTVRSASAVGDRVKVLAVLLAVLASGVMVWRASNAAFSATTSNTGNTWTAGTVSLTDDDSNTAMFTATGLKPNATAAKCITVTYTGNLASSVKLYATSYTGTLGTYLNLTVEQGTGGSYSSCTGFTTGSTLYSGTLAGFAGAKVDFSTGVGSFAPSTNGSTAVYRFTYTVQDTNSAQGLSSTCGFTWEAQNT